MKNFWGLGVPTLLFSACLKTNVPRARRIFSGIILLAILVVFSTVNAKAQTSFSAAEALPSAVFGSVTNDNSGIMVDPGAPSIAGYGANAPLWYVWQAPQSGEVEMDTIGSLDTNFFGQVTPLDTVMAVYTGNSLSSLTQISANDDLYPVPQENEIYPQNIFALNVTNDSPTSFPATNAVPTPPDQVPESDERTKAAAIRVLPVTA